MQILSYLLPIFALSALAAGWMGLQLLARRLGTKNHIEHGGNGCGQCGCGGGVCEREQ
ncbi:MAG: hypothetical protein KDD02_10275 [Phaeodactylibacter sp.]|nr:hypothetical protein [Phaeodactylibacter sp.]MCB9301605.1 hypothetical protein [Lewinellaceae bacterium]